MLILQTFRHFTYVTPHSPTRPSLYLRHSSFSNPPFAFPTSQALHLIHLASCQCQDRTQSSAHSPNFPSLTYVTTHSPTLPLLHLRHSSFSNASPTSQALHLIHLASLPWQDRTQRTHKLPSPRIEIKLPDSAELEDGDLPTTPRRRIVLHKLVRFITQYLPFMSYHELTPFLRDVTQDSLSAPRS